MHAYSKIIKLSNIQVKQIFTNIDLYYYINYIETMHI